MATTSVTCAYPSETHSDDMVDVYHGSTTPTKLCGFHASWNLNTVLKVIRSQPKDGDVSTCRNCGGDIEYDSGNEPPWTHTATSFSDCPVEGDDEPSGFHAEPTT